MDVCVYIYLCIYCMCVLGNFGNGLPRLTWHCSVTTFSLLLFLIDFFFIGMGMSDFFGAQLGGGDFDFSASFRNFCQSASNDAGAARGVEVIETFLQVGVLHCALSCMS